MASARLLPDPERPGLRAAVHLTTAVRPDHDLADLYASIAHRHTNRHPFTGEPVASELLDAFADAARAEEALLVHPGPWHVEHLLSLTREADGQGHQVPDRSWSCVGGPGASRSRPGTGCPRTGSVPAAPGTGVLVRDFTAAQAVADRPTAEFERNPRLALLGTAADRPVDWLRAGQALQWVLRFGHAATPGRRSVQDVLTVD
ncbi:MULTISPECIES: nitroreductase [unclassified Streptomyces]|uniref:nitroreductase n=1 Tax=unclassified Streptomyces TaxID=2593676 RepID=UPI0037FF0448